MASFSYIIRSPTRTLGSFASPGTMRDGVVVHDSLSVSRGPLRRSRFNESHARYALAHPLSCTIRLVDVVFIDNYRRTRLKTHQNSRTHPIHPALLTSKHCPSNFSCTSLPFAWRHLIISIPDTLPGYRLPMSVIVGVQLLLAMPRYGHQFPVDCHYVGLRLSWSAPEQC